jgi:hypothetical protein
MKKSLKNLAGIICLFLLAVSCQKDPIKGCLDADATNYKSDAEEDDGSCTYLAKVVVYQTKLASEHMVAAGTKTVNMYLDNTLIGTWPASSYDAAVPSCDAARVKYTYNLAKEDSKTVLFAAKDENGGVLYSTNYTLLAGEDCQKLEVIK